MTRGRKKKITDVDVLIQMTEDDISRLTEEIREKKKYLESLREQKARQDAKNILSIVEASGMSMEEAENILKSAAKNKNAEQKT